MVLLALVASFAMPVVATLIIRLQWAYYDRYTDPEWEDDGKMYLTIQGCWVFTVAVAVSIEKTTFMIMGEKMTLNIRLQLIEEILHKQVSWFDREDRAPGIITNIISSDIANLNGMTSEVLVTLFELCSIVIIGLVGGIYFSWQAAILCFVLSPIMIVGMYKMMTMQFGQKGGRRSADGSDPNKINDYEKANALLSDVVINYRTIISLGQDNVNTIQKRYEDLLVGPMDDIIKQANKAGLYYGLGVSGRTLYISIVFMLAIEFLVYRLELDSTDVFSGVYLLFFTYMSIGAQAANIPSIKKAKASAVPVFSIIDEPSELDIRKCSAEGRTIQTVKQGRIEFKDVTFNYPTRAQKIMDNFNIDIPAGSKIALVGHSGCGKSTLTSILLRFYNIKTGKVTIDGEDLDKYDVHALREQCGYVMQEPVLFNTDIKKNILFGKPDATDEEIYIAAKKANALQFIEKNDDNLTEAEKEELLNQEYQKAFDKLSNTFPKLASLGEKYGDTKMRK